MEKNESEIIIINELIDLLSGKTISDIINFDTDDMKSLVNQLNNVGKSEEYKKYET